MDLKDIKKFKIHLVNKIHSRGYMLSPSIEVCKDIVKRSIDQGLIEQHNNSEIEGWVIESITEVPLGD